ncbi:MAG: hypothetical protein V3T17_06575 [Pseudomonadales bacterium]
MIQLYGESAITDPVFAGLFKPYQTTMDFLTSDVQIELYEQNLLYEANLYDAKHAHIPLTKYQQKQLRDQLNASIQEILSENELFEYQLRMSDTAGRLRSDIGDFFYNEQEFKDVFTIVKEYEPEWVNPGWQGEVNLTERDNRIRNYLGEDRYQVYKRLQDPGYHILQTHFRHQYISEQDIIDVYTAINHMQQIQTTAITQNMNNIKHTEIGKNGNKAAHSFTANKKTVRLSTTGEQRYAELITEIKNILGNEENSLLAGLEVE